MVLFVLIGVAAFAVDLVHAYLVGQQVQNAADAAATRRCVADSGRHSRASTANTSAAESLADKNLTDDELSAGANISTHCTGPNEMTVDCQGDDRHVVRTRHRLLEAHREAPGGRAVRRQAGDGQPRQQPG